MVTMAGLMASLEKKRVNFSRGDSVSGEVVATSDSEVVLDLGAKSEGILNKKDFLPEDLENLKVGDKLSAFVAVPENESGQTVLTLFKQQTGGGKRFAEQLKKWQKFITARDRQSTVSGKVVEVNKGGLLVELEGGVRGFVPSSQVSLGNMKGLASGELVGYEMKLKVLEVDPGANRLVLSGKSEVGEKVRAKLDQLKVGDGVKGEVIAITPFGLFVNVDGVEGIVFSQEVSWDETGDLKSQFQGGQKVEVKIIGKDEFWGRVNLSIRQLEEDPFAKLLEKFEVDDVVKGTVLDITTQGVSVSLDKGVEGFIPAGKLEQGATFTFGQTTNFLVDSIDQTRRRINLAPFLTTTKGLIYK